MDYGELDIYTGATGQCDNCGLVFEPGQVITTESEGLVFCYSDTDEPGGGCLTDYMFFKLKPKRAFFGEPQVYRVRATRQGGRSVSRGPSLFTRILRVLGFAR